MISLDSELRGLKVDDPKMRLYLQAVADAVDKLNANLFLDDSEPRALELDRKGYGHTKRSEVMNVVPDTLIVKALRFQGDSNSLKKDSSCTMGTRLSRGIIAIPTGVATVLPLGSELFDTDEMHDIVTNNSRITIRHAGIYIVGGWVAFDVAAGGYRELGLKFNGAGGYIVQDGKAGAAAPPPYQSLAVVSIEKVVRDDFFELFAFQDSGAPVNIFAGATFWAHRLS